MSILTVRNVETMANSIYRHGPKVRKKPKDKGKWFKLHIMNFQISQNA